MMICPQNKAECKSPVGCGAMGCSILEDKPPPKPTMAEFERLVDAFETSAASYLLGGFNSTVHEDRRAALIDYVKRMGAE